MKTTSEFTIEQDRQIIQAILLHIRNKTTREDKFAEAVSRITGGNVDQQEFRDWLSTFDSYNIRRK